MSRRRLLVLGAAGATGTLTLTGRLAQMQLVEGREHRARAEDNRLRVVREPARRGVFTDRNGLPLLRNRPIYRILITPAELPERPAELYRRLVKLIGGSPADLERLTRRARDPGLGLLVLATTDRSLAQTIEQHIDELPGVSVEATSAREYIDGGVTSHVVGTVGPISAEQFDATGAARGPYRPTDTIGKNGLELTLEARLRGRAGRRQEEIDAGGRPVRTLAREPSTAGTDIRLTIDLALQRDIHRMLSERIAQFGVASAVVVDPRDGGVLAMVHLPTFGNQELADGMSERAMHRLLTDPGHPLLNGTISSAWPPGSCFKIITALAALELGIVKPDTMMECGGGLQLPGGTFLGCWAAHGKQDMLSALANSCDTYFYQLVGGDPLGRWDGMGPDRLAEWARHFGLGAPTGIELPAEAAGIVPDPNWKQRTIGEQWYHGDTYISAIGQGFYTSTPLQMAMVGATMANGGTRFRPHLTTADPSVGNGSELQPIGRIPARPENIALVREGVRAGMLIGTSPYGARYYGTSWTGNLKEIAIAGKTGTSEYGVRGPDGKLPTHGWFTFWAPHENPVIAGAVFVKHGRGAQEAGVIGTRIVKAYFGIV